MLLRALMLRLLCAARCRQVDVIGKEEPLSEEKLCPVGDGVRCGECFFWVICIHSNQSVFRKP